MQALNNRLMREICRPGFINKIKDRFNNINLKPFNFANGNIEGELDGVYAAVVDQPTGTYLRYTADSYLGKTCEGFNLFSSEGVLNKDLFAHRCYNAHFDARVYSETCGRYIFPHMIRKIIVCGSAVKSYQNFRDGNKGRAAIWAAVSVASIALPFFIENF